jgi:aspartate/methionine/tyrosine aminotransferase
VAELAVWCEAHAVRLISDEIYHGLCHDRVAATVAGAPYAPHAVVINSFSKYYAMTGWRLGWMVVPPDLERSVECLQQNLFISAPTLSQRAAIAAFDCKADLDARVGRYRRNRDILRTALEQAGFGRLAPADGAFYLYAELAERDEDSLAFAARLLAETGIAATPGVDFDPVAGGRAIRFSYAGPEAEITEAARRLIAWRC